MFDGMKTVSTREFLRSPGRVKALQPGQSLAVTDNGKPSFVVTKAGKRRHRTYEEMEREAREICPADRPKVDLVKAMKKVR
jgi:antitoxin (DNA-binding transcriptional repressor) of toxin-antitoxin stability system